MIKRHIAWVPLALAPDAVFASHARRPSSTVTAKTEQLTTGSCGSNAHGMAQVTSTERGHLRAFEKKEEKEEKGVDNNEDATRSFFFFLSLSFFFPRYDVGRCHICQQSPDIDSMRSGSDDG